MTDACKLLNRCLGFGLLALMAPTLHAADLPPVQQGLWRVKSLITFSPDPTPGSKGWPGLEGKPRARDYPICIDESRAKQPMVYPASAVRADDMTMVDRTSDGKGMFEVIYRRLDDKHFEGGWSGTQPVMSSTFAYSAEFVSQDCGAVPPSGASKFGEP